MSSFVFTRPAFLAGIMAAGLLCAGAASAATYTYDFKAAANSGGGIGEAIYTSFDTNSFFAGPNLQITASATDDDPTQYVYFDNGNAGIGVCKDWNGSGTLNAPSNGGSNLCDPGSDDGITELSEVLTFTATDTAVTIDSIWMNANHDAPAVTDATYRINGADYGAGDMTPDNISGSGDVRIDLGFTLNAGDSFTLFALSGSPDSYISAMAVSQVPLPASALLLGGGLFSLGAIRRRRKKTG